MDEDILAMILAFIAGMTGIFCVTKVILTIIHRRPQKLGDVDLGRRLDDISDRLARLEPAIDSMSVEVERISEAQRFTAKILTQRSVQPDTPSKLSGSTTPH